MQFLTSWEWFVISKNFQSVKKLFSRYKKCQESWKSSKIMKNHKKFEIWQAWNFVLLNWITFGSVQTLFQKRKISEFWKKCFIIRHYIKVELCAEILSHLHLAWAEILKRIAQNKSSGFQTFKNNFCQNSETLHFSD